MNIQKILLGTLKHQEQEEFTRFDGQPRLLFFKPLENIIIQLDTPDIDTPEIPISKL